MAKRGSGPDFIEALARGLEVIQALGDAHGTMTISELAEKTNLARPTVRRILLTLEELGYVRTSKEGSALTPRVLELGVSYIQSQGLWDIARPHMEALVAQTHESSSIAQLDGSDIVYVARVAVPKIVALRVGIGTRFPAASTSLGKVLLADLGQEELDAVLAQPSRSGVVARREVDRAELERELADTRAKGWCMTDQDLAVGIRSVAAPLRDATGRVVAALNVNAHAGQTSVDRLLEHHLPRLLSTASSISEDYVRRNQLR